jgi:hypothetical protein
LINVEMKRMAVPQERCNAELFHRRQVWSDPQTLNDFGHDSLFD